MEVEGQKAGEVPSAWPLAQGSASDLPAHQCLRVWEGILARDIVLAPKGFITYSTYIVLTKDYRIACQIQISKSQKYFFFKYFFLARISSLAIYTEKTQNRQPCLFHFVKGNKINAHFPVFVHRTQNLPAGRIPP